MGKRSDFKKRPQDDYPTIDERAVKALIPHLAGIKTYSEPCFGEGRLADMIFNLTDLDLMSYSDIDKNALTIDEIYVSSSDVIITNPPWTRQILHPMILHFKDLRPTWLLFDADWMHTKQAIPYLKFCTDIVSVGRLTWIEGTNMTGKDNCCWYRFDKVSNGIIFHPKID